MSASHTAKRPRRTISQPAAYLLAASVIGLALFASGTPSPLYGTYSELWGFSPEILTLVFATYAFGVLTSLVLAGRVSDEVGRRPVLLVSLTTLTLVTIPFMLADSLVWLFVARGIQGLATGLALSAAGAALLDLHPRRDSHSVALANGVASMLGLGLGVLASSLIVEFLPAPRVLPYALLLVLFSLALLATFFMPEPGEVLPGARVRLTPQRPSIPPVVRRPFVLAGLAVLSSWSIGGLFFSLGPQLSSILFDSTNHVVEGLNIFVLAGAGALAQLAFGRVAPWASAAFGSVALALGMGTIVAASAAGSGALLVVGSIVAGVGFGAAFLGGLRTLSAAIPAEHRAGVMAAFYIAAYASLSLLAVAAGFVVGSLGVTDTFEIFGTAIAGLALVVAFEAWRTRPIAAGSRSERRAAQLA